MKEKVSYGGKIFTRDPDSKNASKRLYYMGQVYDRRRKKSRKIYLHRVIWEDNRGPIPWDCIIHHIDGNALNNDISNLECIPEYLHLRSYHRDRRCSHTGVGGVSSGN